MVGPLAAALGAAAAGASSTLEGPVLFMKFKMSVLVTRPAFPVPGTSLMLMPSFLARNLTAGEDKAF